jgi:hypothetical protein
LFLDALFDQWRGEQTLTGRQRRVITPAHHAAFALFAG